MDLQLALATEREREREHLREGGVVVEGESVCSDRGEPRSIRDGQISWKGSGGGDGADQERCRGGGG